jgi:hypothetical protein
MAGRQQILLPAKEVGAPEGSPNYSEMMHGIFPPTGLRTYTHRHILSRYKEEGI